MALLIRMALYAGFAFLGGLEWASFNDATGDLTINADGLIDLALYAFGFLMTFAWSVRAQIARFLAAALARARGGRT